MTSDFKTVTIIRKAGESVNVFINPGPGTVNINFHIHNDGSSDTHHATVQEVIHGTPNNNHSTPDHEADKEVVPDSESGYSTIAPAPKLFKSSKSSPKSASRLPAPSTPSKSSSRDFGDVPRFLTEAYLSRLPLAGTPNTLTHWDCKGNS
ncbi:hypothetical protein K435DRAFT_849852 [Dendrothele bispora CBS 962.96]|uniref:Uncharacterized protein n=1 Tax=Dendrothele bispora (strain CBS 962.96) TaxID=1314807 RepID=A0A4S8MSH1_DENBC|nr:hypothetical protein K435DRAFT_849852 [Dendrothele bispora CBS 962.96]